MTGLDKIVKQIRDEAQQTANQVVATAKEEAQAMKHQAQLDAKEQAALVKVQAEQNVNNQLAAARSAAELAKRRATLAAKQEIIAAVLAEAETDIYDLPDADYFDLILKMVKKYAQPQTGEIVFSAKDLARIPVGFEEKVASVISGTLTVSRQTRVMEGGFVLTYGDIEENCSIRALFAAAQEQLQDTVQQTLFV